MLNGAGITNGSAPHSLWPWLFRPDDKTLPLVAPLIDAQTDVHSASQPIGAEIVRTCSHYDRLRGEMGASAAKDELIAEAGGLQGRVLEALDEIVREQMSRTARAR